MQTPIQNVQKIGYIIPPSYAQRLNVKKIPQPTKEIDKMWIYDIKYLSLAGGGAKGYAYPGVILALDSAFFKKKRNLYTQLEGISGTSIGALFGLFIVLGFRGQKLIKEVMNINIVDVLKQPNFQSLIDLYGMCSTSMLHKVVFELLERHLGKGDLTFEELFQMTNKHYVCNVTNVHTGLPEYHSHLSSPHFKVYESVVASMCVPFMFSPCIINGQCYIDGGLTDNCPFIIFPLQETLIINLSSIIHNADLSNFQMYIMRIIGNVFALFERRLFNSIPIEEQKRVLRIYIQHITPLDPTLNFETKFDLMRLGVTETEKFLNPELVNRENLKMFIKIIFITIIENKLLQFIH
jgi:predicted acylesterase/phospholipase RssA